MSEAQIIAHATQLHEAQQKKRAEDVVVVAITEKELVAILGREAISTIQVKTYAKVVGDTLCVGSLLVVIYD